MNSLRIGMWAKNNYIIAQILIILIMVILYFVSAFIGSSIFEITANFDSHVLLFISGLIFLGILIHHRKWRSGSINYEKTRYHKIRYKEYLGVILCFILLGVHFGNDIRKSELSENQSIKLMINVLSFNPVISVANSEDLNLNQRKVKIKKFIKRLQEKVVSGLTWISNKFINEKHTGKKIAFIIFGALVAFGLSTLLVLLYCNLYCGGYPVIAVLSLSLGVIAIVFLIQVTAKAFVKYWNRKSGIEKSEANRESWWMTLITIATLALGFFVYISFGA